MFSIQGNIESYQLNLQTGVAGNKIPETKVLLGLSGNQRNAALEKLQVDTLGGQLNAEGQLTIAKTIHWLGTLKL